jgi:hypothetical protein
MARPPVRSGFGIETPVETPLPPAALVGSKAVALLNSLQQTEGLGRLGVRQLELGRKICPDRLTERERTDQGKPVSHRRRSRA